MDVKIAGLTSIDITRRGMNKKFGIEQLLAHLQLAPADALFVGDAFAPEGNDAPSLESGVLCFKVSSVQNTKDLVRHLLS